MYTLLLATYNFLKTKKRNKYFQGYYSSHNVLLLLTNSMNINGIYLLLLFLKYNFLFLYTFRILTASIKRFYFFVLVLLVKIIKKF